MVERAQAQGAERADEVGDDVVKVKVAAVGQEALQELGADAQAQRADDEREVQRAPAVGVEDPVEGDREQEEGEQVQDLVVDVEGEVERRQASVACEEEEEEEHSWGGIASVGVIGRGGGAERLRRALSYLRMEVVSSSWRVVLFWTRGRSNVDSC